MPVNNLSISHIVNSNIRLKSIRPANRGFGTVAILTTVASSGNVDASNLTKDYFSNDEIALDFDSSTEVYKASLFAFAANPRPAFIKIGFVANVANLQDSLDNIEANDPLWTGLCVTAEMRDSTTIVQAIADWCEVRPKIFVADSNDDDCMDKNKSTDVAHLIQNKSYDHSMCVYSSHVNEYLSVALLCRQLSVNFNEKDSYQTSKFKRLSLVTPEEYITNAQRMALTGFVPVSGSQGGLKKTAGKFAGVYSTIKDISHFAEGTMGSGRFIHNIHFWMWLEDVIATDQYAEYLDDPNIPNTLGGYKQMAQVLKRSLDKGERAGGITATVNDDGEYIDAYTIETPSYIEAPDSMKANGILSSLKFCARQAGSLHYTVVNGCVHSN